MGEMKKKKLFFLYNPMSGKGQVKNHIEEITDIFVRAGYEVTVYQTRARNDALQKVPICEYDYDLIVCGGGDGTLDEVVTGLVQSGLSIPIGYIPAGSTNDFAQSLNIPTDMMEAAQKAVYGKPFSCDVGEFNNDIFVYVAAFGLFTDVSYQTNQRMKNRLGHAAYVIEGAKRLRDIQSYSLEVRVNDEVIRGQFVFGMVSNSTSVGGVKNLTGKDVKLDDGLFEVTLIRMPKNPTWINDIMSNLLKLREVGSSYIYTCKADYIEIRCEQEVPWTLDGEFGGRHKDVIINNRCREVAFMV